MTKEELIKDQPSVIHLTLYYFVPSTKLPQLYQLIQGCKDALILASLVGTVLFKRVGGS